MLVAWARRRYPEPGTFLRPRLDVEAPEGVLIAASAALPILPVPLAHQVVVPIRTLHAEDGVLRHRPPIPDDAFQVPVQQPSLAARRPDFVHRRVGRDLEGVGPLGLEDPHLRLAASLDTIRLWEALAVQGVVLGARAAIGRVDPV